jgi:hypothetical protein
MEKNNSKDRVLIIAPVGRDAQGMAELLVGHGFEAQICGSLAECAAHIQSGAVRSCLRRKLSNWAAYRIYSKR